MTRLERSNADWLYELCLQPPLGDRARHDLRVSLLVGLERTVGPRAAGHVEDFAQEALVRVLASLQTFRGDSRFTSWALSIAIRIAYSELRRARFRDVSLDALLAGEGERAPEPAVDCPRASAESSIDRNRVFAALEQAIAEGLTERQRTVVVAELRGMPQEELAERLGIERNALYKLGHDARRALLRELCARGIDADTVAGLLAACEGKVVP